MSQIIYPHPIHESQQVYHQSKEFCCSDEIQYINSELLWRDRSFQNRAVISEKHDSSEREYYLT